MSSKVFDIFKMIVGSIIILGFLSTLGTMLFFPIPIENQKAIYIVLGTLGTLTVSIVSYLFGSSIGSKEKADILANLTNSPPNNNQQ